MNRRTLGRSSAALNSTAIRAKFLFFFLSLQSFSIFSFPFSSLSFLNCSLPSDSQSTPNVNAGRIGRPTGPAGSANDLSLRFAGFFFCYSYGRAATIGRSLLAIARPLQSKSSLGHLISLSFLVLFSDSTAREHQHYVKKIISFSFSSHSFFFLSLH